MRGVEDIVEEPVQVAEPVTRLAARTEAGIDDDRIAIIRALRRMYITASRNLTSNPTGSPSTLRTEGGVSSIFTAMMSASGATPTNEPSDPPDTWLPPAAVAATWVP